MERMGKATTLHEFRVVVGFTSSRMLVEYMLSFFRALRLDLRLHVLTKYILRI